MSAVARKQHYLVSLVVAPDLHMHCYLMCKDERLLLTIPGKLVEMAEERGFRPLPIVLSTILSDRGSIAMIRKLLCDEDEDIKHRLETATDTHCTIWLMGAEHDQSLMELH